MGLDSIEKAFALDQAFKKGYTACFEVVLHDFSVAVLYIVVYSECLFGEFNKNINPWTTLLGFQYILLFEYLVSWSSVIGAAFGPRLGRNTLAMCNVYTPCSLRPTQANTKTRRKKMLDFGQELKLTDCRKSN